MFKGLKLLLLTIILPAAAFPQDQLSLVSESSNSRKLREIREAFVKEHMGASLVDIDARQDPATADRNFVSRAPLFRGAVEKYRTAMGTGQSPAKSLKEIERFVDDFKTYFEQTHVDAPPVDVSEFREFSQTELMWETLTTAERVDTKLRQAALLVHESSQSNITTVPSMLFLRNLHGELRRLDLLISKVK